MMIRYIFFCFFFQAEDGIRDLYVTGVQTCALPISPVVTKYVDGIKQDDWTVNQGLDNPRRALLPTAILFGDGDQDERRIMWVNSIQIRAGKLSDSECFALSGPDAAGIPITIPQSTVSGQWDFEFADLGATIGANLTYFDPTFDGPTGTNANLT